jgi:hypothetical protein
VNAFGRACRQAAFEIGHGPGEKGTFYFFKKARMSLLARATYPAAPDADAGVSFLSGERGGMPGE